MKLTVVLIDNRGYKSIGALSRSLGTQGFGTRYAFPKRSGGAENEAENEAEAVDAVLPSDQDPTVDPLPVDLAMNARSLGAEVIDCQTYDELVAALESAKASERTVVIHVHNDRYVGVGGYHSWWDVPVAEVSEVDTVQAAREEWEEMRAKERYFL
jgi:3D-(3,5/4)-trihydroxycyclohexane-1,2-dione acylhydrolase (decyclizing)